MKIGGIGRMTFRKICSLTRDELDSATDYAIDAIDLKPMAEEWSEKLIKMSADELTHAEHFYAMACEYYKKFEDNFKNVPDEIKNSMNELKEWYAHKSSYVKKLHSQYKG
jgi:hypothetical protein